jgi:hypothetical protein
METVDTPTIPKLRRCALDRPVYLPCNGDVSTLGSGVHTAALKQEPSAFCWRLLHWFFHFDHQSAARPLPLQVARGTDREAL